MSEISQVFEVDEIFTLLSYISTLAKHEMTPGYVQGGYSARGREIGKVSILASLEEIYAT
jgi:hypothetical protein